MAVFSKQTPQVKKLTQFSKDIKMPGERLDMTKEEMDKISEALKKEEFRKLFVEYAEELADPEKRKVSSITKTYQCTNKHFSV